MYRMLHYFTYFLSAFPCRPASGSFQIDQLLFKLLNRDCLPQGTDNSFKTPTVKICLSVLAQFSSVAQSCPTLCDPMNRSTPGLPVHHQLPEFTQTHVYRVGDAIQPSHLLSSPSPAPNPSQHQGLFQ